MKLWQKIFLWTLSIVMMAVSITGIMILKNNYNTSIDRQIDSTLSEHNYLISNTKNKVSAERLKVGAILYTTNDILPIIKGIFDNNDEKEGTKIALINNDGDFLYKNNGVLTDESLIASVIKDEATYKIIKVNKSKHYLIIGSPVTLEKQQFVFLTSTNITNIYDLYKQQLNYTKLLSITLSLGCAFFLLILVKLLLRPLSYLNVATHSIASGDYSKRITISSHNELSELARNMNTMADAVEEKVNLLSETAENRRQFINNLSHEMKTPLTSILGFSDIIRIKRNISNDELVEYSDIIFEEAKRLKSLSGKLMEIITVGETNLEFVDISTKELFSQMNLVLKPIFEKNEVNLISNTDNCKIRIDCELFKSMIFNLVDNAIKASTKGSNIYLTGTYKSEIFTISVEDSGIGIDENELDKILEPFYMIDKARSRKAGGAGLGLPLCKRIADIHDAAFSIESTLNQGTTVTITLKGGELS